ncbi:hypothetical protein HGRIS_002609 [Hohenbuehelia grisea]|uniref:Uncharacterized protein n=1 Tax=Hohenbuehelia grisea TaxID=104357 RepID=A0ABR3JL07_9AGAR
MRLMANTAPRIPPRTPSYLNGLFMTSQLNLQASSYPLSSLSRSSLRTLKMPFFAGANRFTIRGGVFNDIARDSNSTTNNGNTHITNTNNTHAETTVDSHHNSSKKFAHRSNVLVEGQGLPSDNLEPQGLFSSDPVSYGEFNHNNGVSPLVGFTPQTITIRDQPAEFLTQPQPEYGQVLIVEGDEDATRDA